VSAASVRILNVDDLSFSLRRSPRRNTLQITVDRGGELLLFAPPEADEAKLRDFVQEKRFWIYTKLAQKDRLQRLVPMKEMVDGEAFLYLGRCYRLLLVDEQDVPLKPLNGRFLLPRDQQMSGREHFVRWYSDRAKAWLTGRVVDFASRMDIQPVGVRVQELGYRWGSCGRGGWLYFHWKTILLPARIAEYVMVHEMAHLREAHHTPEFWLRVERAMPDYEQRKAWLAEHGMDVEGI
jgi:predicted metal-dependent hydrolase